jgi:hypothetical protein
VLVVLGAWAVPAHGANELIRPGVGIGKIQLGMTAAQVRRAMGRPLAATSRQESFGRRVTEWQFGLAAYVVVLAGRSTQRVTSVTTSIRRERTSEGFGVGTAEARLVARFGSRLRCEQLHTGPFSETQRFEIVLDKNRDCVLTAASGAETVFRTWVRPVVLPDPGFRTEADWVRAEVLEVEVRAN